MFHLTKPEFQRPRGPLRADPGDRQAGAHRHDPRWLRRAVERAVHAWPGRLPRGLRSARVRPRRGTGGDRGVGGRERTPGDPVLDHTDRDDEGDRRLRAAEVGRRRRRRVAGHARAVGADHQRPARLPGLRCLLVAQPRRPVRREPDALVARLRLRRVRCRDGRRRAVAQLRAPQRSRAQRPARPGPRDRGSPRRARRWLRRSTGSSPTSAGSSRSGRSSGASTCSRTCRTSVATRCPTVVASWPTAPGSPARSGSARCSCRSSR